MMYRSTAAKALALFAAAAATMPMFSDAVKHPLDSLAPDEYSATVQILTGEGHFNDDTRVPRIALIEPAKAFVKAWSPGEPFPRKVTAILKEGVTTYKAVVDLGAASVDSIAGLTAKTCSSSKKSSVPPIWPWPIKP
jgi:Cu2+-containing amine oxidase